jgi:membrane protein YdbS with pleckstrin-like domain
MLENNLTNSFANQMVDSSDLPRIQQLEQQSLSKSYASINLKLNIGFTLFILTIGIALYFQPFFELNIGFKQTLPYVISALAILGLLVIYHGYQSDIRKTYSLRDLDLHYSSGLFFRKTVSQPITRIQHIELKRGPIDRKVGLAKLQVFSAGGAMHTFEIPGLTLESAQQLRQFIIEHKDVVKNG